MKWNIYFQKIALFIVFLQCSLYFVATDEIPETRDIDADDYDDLGRKHKKKKKHQNNPCYGGYGKTFGEKFGPHDYTYINAPVTNYFLGCGGGGGGPPIAPIQYPAQFGGHGGHGHGGHGGHGHGGHGQGGYGQGGYGQGGYQGFPGLQGPANYGHNPGFQQFPSYPQYQNNRPFQNVASAAASGFGNAIAGYFNRPRKVNKQINQFLRPLYKLF